MAHPVPTLPEHSQHREKLPKHIGGQYCLSIGRKYCGRVAWIMAKYGLTSLILVQY